MTQPLRVSAHGADDCLNDDFQSTTAGESAPTPRWWLPVAGRFTDTIAARQFPFVLRVIYHPPSWASSELSVDQWNSKLNGPSVEPLHFDKRSPHPGTAVRRFCVPSHMANERQEPRASDVD